MLYLLILLACPLSFGLTRLLLRHRPYLGFLPLLFTALFWVMSWREAVTPDYLMDFRGLVYGLLGGLVLIGWLAGAGGQWDPYRPPLFFLMLQLLVFYFLPSIRLRTDPIGTVITMVLLTLFLSVCMGIWCRSRINLLYPPVVALLFLPSLPVYYNESALVHALWYLAVSAAGLAAGTALYHSGTKRRD